MKRVLSRLGLIGLVAAAAMGASVAASSAQCGWGYCPPSMVESQHNWRAQHVVGPERHHLRPQWKHGGWNKHGAWKRHHRHRPHLGRHIRRGANITIGIWGGIPRYYDDYWYQPQYRYVDPLPRKRVIRLSAAHIEWCYARYKTYRASDNTYKPTKNTRRQCISPYS